MSLTPSCVPPNHTQARSPFGSHARLAAWHCTVGVGRYAVWPPPSRGRSGAVGRERVHGRCPGDAHDSPRAALRWAVAACSRWMRSDETVARVKPWPRRLAATSPLGVWNPAAMPAASAAARIRSTAASKALVDGGVGGRRAADGDAQVGRTDVEAVDAGRRRDGLDVLEPLRRLDHGEDDGRVVGVGRVRADPQLRPHGPVGADAERRVLRERHRAAASSAVLTSGTMMPAAPASRAWPMRNGSLAPTRTMPTDSPPASMAVMPARMPL